MTRFIRSTSILGRGGLLVAALAATGCDLTGPKLTEDPNNPIEVTAGQALIAIQASQFLNHESQLARLAAMYTQQLSGTNNQQKDWGSSYLIGEGDLSGRFAAMYTGGGLIDLRRVQQLANEAGDAKVEGVAKIWEAYVIGTTTAIWGDIPYSQAVSAEAAPVLDPQQQVYAALQTLLDQAIPLLSGAGAGPGATDLVYGGNMDRWRRAAFTLKARYHMHTGERLGNAAYTAALAAAANGINEAPTTVNMAMDGQAPGNFRAYHDNNNDQGNIWTQFLTSRNDMTAGAAFVNLLVARNDPRLARYFVSNRTGGTFAGSDQFGRPPAGGASTPIGAARHLLNFRTPLITWEENKLILAEANFRLGNTAAALTNLNDVRLSVGLAPLTTVTFNDIAAEKYIAMYQNIEAWSDYRRNCFPALTPGGANNTPAAEIPGRAYYGLQERQANSTNIPLPSAQPLRNWNDPNACPRP